MGRDTMALDSAASVFLFILGVVASMDLLTSYGVPSYLLCVAL